MELSEFYSVIISLLVLLAVGFIGSKSRILKDDGLKGLSAVTIKIAQPCMIIGAMINVEFTRERLLKGLLVVGVGLVAHIIMALIAHF